MRQPSYWIIGGGRFGRLACERLRAANPGASICVVDRREVAVSPDAETVTADAMAFLHDNLQPQAAAWIVPAVPIHLAYAWLAGRLQRERNFKPHAVPQGLLPLLPNPCFGPDGQVYLSNADFRCPDDCPEPKSICTHTGQPRPRVMHTYLAGLVFGAYTSIVMRSVQLAPGVGGYQSATLLEGLDQVRAKSGDFLFSTACKCHAVMHAFSLD